MYENVRDRGKIKWTALMLPEHIAKLREWQAEDEKVPQPVLSEFDLKEIQNQLESARMKKCMTQIRIWQEHKIIGYIGTVEEIDIHNRIIILEDPYNTERIPADLIIAVQHLE